MVDVVETTISGKLYDLRSINSGGTNKLSMIVTHAQIERRSLRCATAEPWGREQTTRQNPQKNSCPIGDRCQW